MYSLVDIIEMLDLSERTVRRHLKLGVLKGTKESGKWHFSEQNIEEYLSHSLLASIIKQKHMKDYYEYSKGMGDLKELVLVSKNIPNENILNIKSFSKRISEIKGPMRFALSKFGSHTNVAFYGTIEGIKEFMELIK